MRATRTHRTTIPADQIPTWSSRFAAASCVLVLIAGFAWASPAARLGFGLIRSTEESRTPLVETSARRLVHRFSAADEPTKAEPKNAESLEGVNPLVFSTNTDFKSMGRPTRFAEISLRKDIPYRPPATVAQAHRRSRPREIANRLLQELRHQVELGLRRLGRVAFSSTLPCRAPPASGLSGFPPVSCRPVPGR